MCEQLLIGDAKALLFIVKPVTTSKEYVSKEMGPLVKLLTNLLHVFCFEWITYCNLIMYIIIFLHLFYRLLILTFVFGWGEGIGYRCGAGIVIGWDTWMVWG